MSPLPFVVFLKRDLGAIAIGMAALASLACQRVDFDAQKADLLSKTTVFSSEEQPGMSVRRLCSDRRSKETGSNVKSSLRLEVRLLDPATGDEVCRTQEGVRDSLMNERIVNLAGCPDLPGKTYETTLIDPDKASENLLYDSGLDNDKKFYVALQPDGKWLLTTRSSQIETKKRGGRSLAGSSAEVQKKSQLFVLYN